VLNIGHGDHAHRFEVTFSEDEHDHGAHNHDHHHHDHHDHDHSHHDHDHAHALVQGESIRMPTNVPMPRIFSVALPGGRSRPPK
jgi:hypothetical protein